MNPMSQHIYLTSSVSYKQMQYLPREVQGGQESTSKHMKLHKCSETEMLKQSQTCFFVHWNQEQLLFW